MEKKFENCGKKCISKGECFTMGFKICSRLSSNGSSEGGKCHLFCFAARCDAVITGKWKGEFYPWLPWLECGETAEVLLLWVHM